MSIIVIVFVFTSMIAVIASLSLSSSPSASFITCSQSSSSPLSPITPQLILIAGATGIGKSTLAMEIAIEKNIVTCISTDTIREVARMFDPNPAIHRSSYTGDGDAINQWAEGCSALHDKIDGVIKDAIKRGNSVIIEGVHVWPDNKLLDYWRDEGGCVVGCVLRIDAELHRKLIYKRGETTAKGSNDKLKMFDRIRSIHDEMVRIGEENGWIVIQQNEAFDRKPSMLDESIR